MTARGLFATIALLASAVAFAQDGAQSQIAPYHARFNRSRPVVAVVGENAATELVDFVVPFGILSQSGTAEVHAVAARAGVVHLWPALKIAPQDTLESFDEAYSQGADYVVVPAMMFANKRDEAAMLAWITAQAGKGAVIVSICDGSMLVAETGLLAGHRATGHWATQSKREKRFPATQWIHNVRYVADGQFISSAGVTAAIPLSIALVESIAGRDKAAMLANELGVGDWSPEHDSDQFHLGAGQYFTALKNLAAFNRDFAIPVADGVDELSLAITADAYSRTFRSHVFTVSDSAGTIRTRSGLVLMPDRIVGESRLPRQMLNAGAIKPGAVLDRSLADISAAFGRATSRFVALQLEYSASPL